MENSGPILIYLYDSVIKDLGYAGNEAFRSSGQIAIGQ